MDKHTSSKSDSMPQIALKQQQEHALFKGKEVVTGHIDTCIDSLLPSPEPLDNAIEEAVGGMAGMIQETPTNVQEGVPKGRGELPHVVHEDVVDLSSNYRGFNTPISTHKTTGQQGDIDTGQQKGKFNNKSGDMLNKGPHTEDQDVNKDRHGRPPQDDYEALNSKDELDSDNQSIDESGEEEVDNNN
ncbi:hypothetical protein KY284_023854 [Solanum tuberosum]|nr:hypothetical protein KY284_023854 [Solanum tuberosum]